MRTKLLFVLLLEESGRAPLQLLFQQLAEIGGSGPRAGHILLIVISLFGLFETPQGKADLTLALDDIYDLGRYLIALLEHTDGRLDLLLADLGNVDQPFDPLFDLDEQAEVG